MLEWISLDLAYMCVASYSCIILYPGFDHRLWDGQPTQYIDFVPRSFYSPGPTSCYLRVLDLPADDNVTYVMFHYAKRIRTKVPGEYLRNANIAYINLRILPCAILMRATTAVQLQLYMYSAVVPVLSAVPVHSQVLGSNLPLDTLEY